MVERQNTMSCLSWRYKHSAVDMMLLQDWFVQCEVFLQAGANLHEN